MSEHLNHPDHHESATHHGEHHEHHQDRTILTLHEFSIDAKGFFLPHGYYLVCDLKRIASIQPSHVLAEIRGTDVDDLADDAAVHIKGHQVFKSYPGKGDNS